MSWNLTTRKIQYLLAVLVLFAALVLPDGQARTASKSSCQPHRPMWVTSGPYPPMVHPVRVGIATRAPMARIAVWAPGWVFVDNQPMMPLKPQVQYVITSGKLQELSTGQSFPLPRDRRTQIAARDAMGNYAVWANNRWWRGSLEIICIGNSVTVVNLLDLEDYLQGVVPSEMPASWHPEALKSQAVAARSYAWAHLAQNNGSKWFRSEGYDLVPDVRDQAYKGLAAEAPSTRLAVYHTQGVILRDSGRVKPGFYRATVGDYYENLNIRKKSVPAATLERLTGVKNIVGVTVKRWDTNLNAHTIQVMGAKSKPIEVYGVALAKMIGLSTAGILDIHEEGSNWVFTCRGPGNGARGLSQHGANALAKNGWRYEQILQHYYQDSDGQLRLEFIDGYSRAAAAASYAAAAQAFYRRYAPPPQQQPPQQQSSTASNASNSSNSSNGSNVSNASNGSNDSSD